MDVLIVGGGLAGCAAAYFLAPKYKVHLIEQAPQLGAEASAQNAGMQRRLVSGNVERQLAVRAGQFYASAPESFQAGIRRVGGILTLQQDPHRMDDAAADLRHQGIEVHDITGSPWGEVARRSPHQRAWYLPDEALLDAHILVSAFWSGARAHGATREHSTVEALAPKNGRLRAVHTSSGVRYADRVVLATGAWSQHLAATAGLSRRLTPLARHLFHTKPHPLSQVNHPWVWCDDAGVYVRPEAGGWMLSPCDEEVRFPDGVGSRCPIDPLIRALAVEKLRVHFPAVAAAQIAGGWTGLRTFTPDRAPLLGPDPELDGLIWATGLGGYGVTCAPAVGEAIAAYVGGSAPDWLSHDGVAVGRDYPRPLQLAELQLERYANE